MGRTITLTAQDLAPAPAPTIGGLTPTDEQEAILVAFSTLADLVVEAGAGCLAGDTVLNINRGGCDGIYDGYGKGSKVTIEHVAQQLRGVARTPHRRHGKIVMQRARPWDLTIPTYVARADDDVSKLGVVVDAWASGVQDTFTVHTETGRTIRATRNHPFLIDYQYVHLWELKPGDSVRVCTGRSQRPHASKAQYRYVDTSFHPYQTCRSASRKRYGVPLHRAVVEAAMNGITITEFIAALRNSKRESKAFSFLPIYLHVHHRDGNSLNNDLDNLEIITPSDHHRHHAITDGHGDHVLWQIGSEKIASIEHFGEEMTYDLEVADDPHNFLANGFVVHNCGKTSTLKMMARQSRGRGVYIAYNKAIADEAKASFPTSVQCATAHSLAFRSVGVQFAHRLNGPRLPARETARRLGFRDDERYAWGLPMSTWQAARLVMETITKFCYSSDFEITAHHIPWVHGLQPSALMILREELPKAARRAWEDLTSPTGHLRFSHDVYLKLWTMRTPQLPVDYVLLDEAQDANPCIAYLVEKQQRQRILVGDSAQQIYAWRGAQDAMRNFDGVRLPLTQSFRFGQPIADEANRWLDKLSAPIRLRGSAIESTIGPVDLPRAVLCRTNATTVEELMRANARGVKTTLVGSGAQIRGLAEAAIDLMRGSGTAHPELFMFKSWDELKEYVDHDAAGQDLRSFVRLIDQHGPSKVIQAIDGMAKPADAETFISTAHKAKGLEWDTVRIAGDFGGQPKGESIEPSPAEQMLSYVAVTRAKHAIDLGSLAEGFTKPLNPADDA